MPDELQRLIDSLGDRLDRSVALDDPGFRLLAYTSHQGEVDEARVASIMQRGLSAGGSDYVRGTGALEATDLFRVPARAEFGFAIPRIGMPIRFERTLLGFIWLLESDGEVEEWHVEALRETAGDIARLLHRRFLLGEIERHRERELSRDLLSYDAQVRGEAAALLMEEELLAAGPVVAMTITMQAKRGAAQDDRERVAVAVALDHVRRRVAPGEAVHLERPDHGILLVSSLAKRSATQVNQLAVALRNRAVGEAKKSIEQCWVGIGEPRSDLVSALESYAEARKAMEVAREVGALGTVVHYKQLGVYGLLATLSPAELRISLHPGLEKLRAGSGSRDFLTETLEAYLDNAGSVKRTSAQLRIQPASLYYRLKRIEEIAEVDLGSGDDRLALHQSLKIAHLIGWTEQA